jgi:DeoR/GlpR family transcriptional regulator of sugar metabolism
MSRMGRDGRVIGEVRRQHIVRLLNEQDSVTVRELAEHFEVSQMTINRDLEKLDEAGIVRRVHGGATAQPTSLYESSLVFRMAAMTEEKSRIGRCAARYVTPGSSLVLDDSSTALEMVRRLAGIADVTVVTNFFRVVEQLRTMRGGPERLILLGGTYDSKYESTGDLLTEKALDEVRVDRCFLSVPAVDLVAGVFHQDAAVARIKRAMMDAAVERFLLVDSSKLGKRALHRIAALEEFDGIVVGSGVSPEDLAALRARVHNVEVAVAGPADHASENGDEAVEDDDDA